MCLQRLNLAYSDSLMAPTRGRGHVKVLPHRDEKRADGGGTDGEWGRALRRTGNERSSGFRLRTPPIVEDSSHACDRPRSMGEASDALESCLLEADTNVVRTDSQDSAFLVARSSLMSNELWVTDCCWPFACLCAGWLRRQLQCRATSSVRSSMTVHRGTFNIGAVRKYFGRFH